MDLPASPEAPRRVLVVEDEFFIAADYAAELERAGLEVVGPVGTIAEAVRCAREERLDGAILDMNLRGEPVLPAARLLVQRDVPFVLVSGYDDPEMPDWMPDVPRFSKPMSIAAVVERIRALI